MENDRRQIDFAKMIDEGLTLAQSDPQHDLRLGFRRRLMSSVGSTDVAAPEAEHIGHRRRVKLAMATVGHVMPLWKSIFPSDRTPDDAMTIASNVMDGTITAGIGTREAGRLWSHCDNLLWKNESGANTIMIGYGAVQVIRGAISDAHFGCAEENENITDFDVDPQRHDTSFFAAVAYSDGAVWESTSNAIKRLEFWKWWLTSAVPSVRHAAA
jgi:hypothetical protein